MSVPQTRSGWLVLIGEAGFTPAHLTGMDYVGVESTGVVHAAWEHPAASVVSMEHRPVSALLGATWCTKCEAKLAQLVNGSCPVARTLDLYCDARSIVRSAARATLTPARAGAFEERVYKGAVVLDDAPAPVTSMVADALDAAARAARGGAVADKMIAWVAGQLREGGRGQVALPSQACLIGVWPPMRGTAETRPVLTALAAHQDTGKQLLVAPRFVADWLLRTAYRSQEAPLVYAVPIEGVDAQVLRTAALLWEPGSVAATGDLTVALEVATQVSA